MNVFSRQGSGTATAREKKVRMADSGNREKRKAKMQERKGQRQKLPNSREGNPERRK